MTALISDAELIARRLPVAGTFNLRDVGGYPTADGRATRWRTLLRADALDRVDEDGRSTLREVGLRTSIDLRDGDERSSAPDQLHREVRLVHLPVFAQASPEALFGREVDRASGTLVEEVYRLLVGTRGPVIVAVLRELAQPGTLPAVVHCTAGKDRTGVVVALLLSVLGVPDEVVAADFTATNLFLNEEFRRALAERIPVSLRDDEELARGLTCAPELLLDVFAEIREAFGSVGEYLHHHGLTTDERARLQDALLEETEDVMDNGRMLENGAA